MILYRALNEEDMDNYNNDNYIFCSLYNAKFNKINKRISKNYNIYYNLCLLKDRKYALDSIIGHISGKRLSVNISPWVSTSTDFDFVVREYAVPQAGNYNYQRKRKPVLVIDIDDDKVYSDYNKIIKLRDSRNCDFAIDLRNGLLNEYYDKNAISSEKYNIDMPGYNLTADANRELLGYKTSVQGFSNYAYASSEVLIYGAIDKKYNKVLIYPLLQDIIYSIGVDINELLPLIINDGYKINFTINNFCKEFDPLFRELYPSNEESVNLTDYLVDNYNCIPGNNIEEKYNYLKEEKKKMLGIIVNKLNLLFNTSYKVTRLIDDSLLVSNYENLNNLSDKQRNDLLLIEKDNSLYSYVNESNEYISNDNKLSNMDVLKLIRKK